MTSRPDEITAMPDHVVVLVHGTFAQGAEWTRPESVVGAALSRALRRSHVYAFDWSGRNTHRARLRAGADLAQRLLQVRQAHPSARLHVVAHSHGGNVVGYALRAAGVRQAVDDVVCLGTPFIVAQARALQPTLGLVRTSLLLWSAVSTVLLLLIALLASTLAIYQPGVMEVTFGIALVVAASLAFRGLMRGIRRVGHWLETQARQRLQSTQESIIASLELFFGETPVLNVQTRRDEAASYLRLVTRVAEAPFRAWSPVAVTRIMIGLTVLLLAGLGYVTLTSDDWREAPLEALAGLVMGYAAVLGTVALTLLVLVGVAQLVCMLWAKIFRGHALGFGEEGVTKNWLVAITSSRTPPAAVNVRTMDVGVTGKGLRHSLLYEDPAVVQMFVAWLADAANGQRDPTVPPPI